LLEYFPEDRENRDEIDISNFIQSLGRGAGRKREYPENLVARLNAIAAEIASIQRPEYSELIHIEPFDKSTN